MDGFYKNEAGVDQIDKVFKDKKNYTFDFTGTCAAEGASVASYTLDVADGLTKTYEGRDEALIDFTVDDGVPGYAYPVRCTVVLDDDQAQEFTKTMYINVVAEQ